MRRRSRGRRQRKSRQRDDRTGLGEVPPDPRGDIPRHIKRDIETVSFIPPTPSSIFRSRQLVCPNDISLSTSTQALVYNFTLDTVPNYASLSIWDQYRIDCIRFTLIPQSNALQATAISGTVFPPVFVVIDYDDSTALSSQASAQNYDNCIELGWFQSMSRSFKPRAALAAYAGAFNNYANVPSPWLDTVSHGVQHYGIKMWLNAGIAAQTTLPRFSVSIEYFLSFRSLIV